MLSMGGVDDENRTFTAPTTADPWTYGIGILDLTELKWTDSYDPDAPAYDSPAVVKEWYDAGNLADMQWDSAEVEAIFMTQGSAATPTPTQRAVASSPHSTGVIVGGAVGGVLGVAALGMMSFLLVRRRRRRRDSSSSSTTRFNTPGLGRHRQQQQQSSPNASVQEEIGEYRPEPWPKDHHASRYAYSPDSLLSGATATQSPSVSPYPLLYPNYAKTHGEVPLHGGWRSELPAHQDGVVGVVGGELPGTEPRIGELMDSSIQWAYELPAPLGSDRTELPDRPYLR